MATALSGHDCTPVLMPTQSRGQGTPARRLIFIASLLICIGCSQTPAPPPLPKVSPRKAANEAMALYDANDDGMINADELSRSPALQVAQLSIDVDNDGSITAREIATRVRAWRNSTARMMKANPSFYFQGEPLAGATVTLEPAPFLGPNYPTSTATTDARGIARFGGHDRRYPGVYVGLYTVRVSKLKDGQETIPAKYNTQSELAYEASAEQWTNTLFSFYNLEADD